MATVAHSRREQSAYLEGGEPRHSSSRSGRHSSSHSRSERERGTDRGVVDPNSLASIQRISSTTSNSSSSQASQNVSQGMPQAVHPQHALPHGNGLSHVSRSSKSSSMRPMTASVESLRAPAPTGDILRPITPGPDPMRHGTVPNDFVRTHSINDGYFRYVRLWYTAVGVTAVAVIPGL